MANELSAITPESRFALVREALNLANKTLLQEQNVEVGLLGQWPRKREDPPDAFDEKRPDIDLCMRIMDKWVPIDIIYIREMPIEPEKLKTVAKLANDIVTKALGHLFAMLNKKVLFSSSGSKYDTSHLTKHTFSFDEQGYIRLDGLRIAHKKPDGDFLPLKAANVRSHTIQVILEQSDDVVNITDEFDQIRTDGRKGMYCLVSQIQKIAVDQLSLPYTEEAESYEKEKQGLYIPMVRQLPSE